MRTLKDTPACIRGLTGISCECLPEFEKDSPLRCFLHKSGVAGRTHHIHLAELLREDRNAYTDAKTSFILEIERRTKSTF